MNEICLSCRKHTKCSRAIHERIGCSFYAPLTNEEYIRQCSTEELAKVISDLINYTLWCTEEEALAWLKEKYYGNTSTENL